jgi:hypothetical protein
MIKPSLAEIGSSHNHFLSYLAIFSNDQLMLAFQHSLPRLLFSVSFAIKAIIGFAGGIDHFESLVQPTLFIYRIAFSHTILVSFSSHLPFNQGHFLAFSSTHRAIFWIIFIDRAFTF